MKKTAKSIAIVILLVFSTIGFMTKTSTAQTFPAPSSCTSNDLSLVGITLTGGNLCNTCTPGTTLTRTVNFAINNKTGSTRTSFAFWGTLQIFNDNGTLASSTPYSGCVGPVPKNATTTFQNGTLSYQCGQSLRLVNIYLAWTDASANSTCATLLNNTAGINPKCGVLPAININAGVNGTVTTTDATCSGNGSITITPFGGKAPYSINIGSTTFTNVTTATTFNNLAPGTYTATITDANACTNTKIRTIAPASNFPAAPTGSNQTQCQANPIQTLTASATAAQGTVRWFNAATGGTLINNPTLNTVGSVTYFAETVFGTCTSASRTPIVLTINQTPAAPVSGGNITECEQSSIQTLTATATGSNVTWYTASTGGSLVASPTLNTVGTATYHAMATLGTCNSFTRTPVTLTINPTPAAPVSGGNISECEQSPIQTLTATATGSNVTWFTASSGGSLVASPTLNTVGTATYHAMATLGTCNSFTRTPVTLTINPTPAAPISGGDIIECEQSSIQTLTASATGSNVTWFTASSGGSLVASPTLNTVGTATYHAMATLGTCNSFTRTPVTLTINPTPAAPISGGDITECVASPVQTLTATASGSNVTWYTASNGGALVHPPSLNAIGTITYHSMTTLGSCNSFTRTPVTLTINPSPANATICIVQPNLCGPATGSITIVSPVGDGYLYSINNGTSYQSSTLFDNLQAGSVTGILVKDNNTCVSSSVDCSNSDCTPPASTDRQTTPASNDGQTTRVSTVKNSTIVAYPNPFTDNVKFEVNVAEEGDALLEVFNMFGQRVQTVFQGHVKSGVSTFDLNISGSSQANYIYRMTIGGKQLTGKLFKVNY
ncbi:MAG: hypothetical protein RL516_1271 [Bacteroidota bacterium]|jgi:hypothetical protein